MEDGNGRLILQHTLTAGAVIRSGSKSDNEVRNVDHVDESDQVLLLLIRQWFGKTMCWHFRGGDPWGGDPFCLHFLRQPTIMGVDMLQMSQ